MDTFKSTSGAESLSDVKRIERGCNSVERANPSGRITACRSSSRWRGSGRIQAAVAHRSGFHDPVLWKNCAGLADKLQAGPRAGFPGDCELSPGQFDAGLKRGLAHAQRGAGIAEKLPVRTGLTLKSSL